MLIQRRNLLESVRPELVLSGWTRRAEGQGDAAHEVIAFQSIKNVGRGAALRIYLHAAHEVAGRPTANLSSMTRRPILAANEATDVNGEIVVWWKNVEPAERGPKYLAISIRILCWDSRDMRHETRYNLFAVELATVGLTDEIAPGLALASRTTVTRPVWLLKLFRQLSRIPGLGRLHRKVEW